MWEQIIVFFLFSITFQPTAVFQQCLRFLSSTGCSVLYVALLFSCVYYFLDHFAKQNTDSLYVLVVGSYVWGDWKLQQENLVSFSSFCSRTLQQWETRWLLQRWNVWFQVTGCPQELSDHPAWSLVLFIVYISPHRGPSLTSLLEDRFSF